MALPSNFSLSPNKCDFFQYSVAVPAYASGAIASGSTSTNFIFQAPYDCKLYGVTVIPDSIISGVATNYTSFSLLHFPAASGGAGGSTTLASVTMSGTSTIWSGGYSVAFYNPEDSSGLTTSGTYMDAGDTLAVRLTNTGLGFVDGTARTLWSIMYGS